MKSSDIRRRAFTNFNKNIGNIALIIFFIMLISAGVNATATMFYVTPVDIITNIAVCIFSGLIGVAIIFAQLKVYRDDSVDVSVIYNVFDRKNLRKYLKCVIGVYLFLAFFYILVRSIWSFAGSAMINNDENSLLLVSIILGIIAYISTMLLQYVFFVAIDSKENARLIDIFSISNKILKGNRKRHFLMDLFFFSIISAVTIVFIVVFLIVDNIGIVGAVSVFVFTIIFISTSILLLYLTLLRAISFVGLYEEFLIDCKDYRLMKFVYDKDFISYIETKKEIKRNAGRRR